MMPAEPATPFGESPPATSGSWRTFPHLLRGPSIKPVRSNARVRIFNVKFSPNLGDGLLSECLERALIDCGTAADTWSVDLAGRTGYAAGATTRSAQLRLLDAIPAPLRQPVVRLPLAIQAHRVWRPHYREALKEADCVVIGGGNLLTDLDLNFPTKIAIAMDEAARRNLPVFIYACGASANWSPPAKALLEGALRHRVIRRVFVRDERSRRIWNDLAGVASNLEATLVRDPGLLAAECYNLPTRRPREGSRVVGINIISQLALRYHCDRAPSATQLDAWYIDLASTLLAQGHCLAIFTNGSPEDRATLERLRPAFEQLTAGNKISFPAPRTPGELAGLIAGFSALAAFRMHAVIAAYACGVPCLALAWDAKLEAFLHSVGRESWLCRTPRTSGTAAARRLQEIMRIGIPDPERELVVTQARRGVAMLQDEIVKALAGR